MTLTDLLIIYLSFGAPIAVYKYLQNRGTDHRRRVVISVLTFFFWLPAAFEIGYLYLRNAYSNAGFVSQKVLDSPAERIRELRDAITSELVRYVRGSSLHDVRETVERYVGLSDEIRCSSGASAGRNDFFDAAGRQEHELGHVCLMRRNLHRLERHHIQARRDFVDLLEGASDRFAIPGAVDKSIELATQLDDGRTVQELSALKEKRGEVWKPEQCDQPPSIKTVPPIAMTALNNE